MTKSHKSRTGTKVHVKNAAEPPQKRRKTALSKALGINKVETIQTQPQESQFTSQIPLPLPQPQASPPTATIPPEQSETFPPIEALLPEVLAPNLAHLQTKYNLATMSIISSSKINQKVRALLSHLQRFSFTDLKAKPGVVVLHAKAEVASKMISVVEITKREIEKEKGKWYQYSKVGSRVEEMKTKRKEKAATRAKGQSLKESKESNIGKTQKEQSDKIEADEVFATAREDTHMDDHLPRDEEMVDDEDEEEAFQTMTMKEPEEKNEQLPKVRAILIMTIYMAMVPVPEFKELYGEQTNA